MLSVLPVMVIATTNIPVNGCKWIYLDTYDTLTCNWGDFRIPESGRLDGGCGEFIPNEAFYYNGWKTYIDRDRHGWVADPEHAYYDSIYQADINWWK